MAIESTCVLTISRSCLVEEQAQMSDRCNYEQCWSHGAMISLLQVPRGGAGLPLPTIFGESCRYSYANAVRPRASATGAPRLYSWRVADAPLGRRTDDSASRETREKLPPHHKPPIVAEASRPSSRRVSRPRLRYRNANCRASLGESNIRQRRPS